MMLQFISGKRLAVVFHWRGTWLHIITLESTVAGEEGVYDQ